ncbi:hypothetical protein TRFO_12893 [Tritrichomonas foetus]|uniref:DUF3447 domain-containing protein n=1 Tax=Tritrichomonas foetus TaxID=1144522 RepID=A0A1J4L157_9EUKA|nr:hypothetical protein TRFO_12893 [Tritrichomonas foetus]|eukprot:OHT16816.1 hypothetical protein TRFO_12893 [Tritrichomonas foetus]
MNNRFQNEVQEAIEIHNMLLGLDSLDVEAAFARVISYLKTDSRSLKLQILLALNYAIFWRPSKSNHFEMIIRNIIPILSSSDFSHEQLKYEIFPSKQFTKLINKKSKSKTTETETKTEKTPTLIEIIKLDDVLSFQDILSQSNIDIDDSVTSSDEFNVFLRELHGIKKSKNESKLLNLAAFYGSINIFKFLWMNNATISSTITNYAVIGGNYDMIHLIEKIPFNKMIYTQL